MNPNVEEKEKEEVEVDVIIIDLGSGMVKAGWAGEDAPRCVVPNLVLEKNIPASAMDPSTEYLVGDEALKVLHAFPEAGPANVPMDRCEVKDWDAVQKVLTYVFQKELRVDPTQFPVLVTVAPLTSADDRSELAHRMFRHFKVPSLCLCNAAVLSLFSTGRTTGIVLEVGEGLAHAVPIYEGFCLPHAVLQLPVAGIDLTRTLKNILEERGVEFDESQLDIVRDIKEKLCAVKTGEGRKRQMTTLGDDDDNYELPGGQIITIDDKPRYNSPEILFFPELTGTENMAHPPPRVDYGVPKMVVDSISMCDPNLQKDLYKNIVLAGGTTMLFGFAERMKMNIGNLVDSFTHFNVVADSQRKYGAWIGGSMYGSLSTFPDIKVTQQEYINDNTYVHKKFF
mmetsp:Transcript_39174/g.77014  ORF Transcript_39174/g.77014 Transcript_39174/m.77014 type:complete len:396 (-) Transcript_39174:339-1526(-)|eukprot:CAMPEP_0175158052 /NCGR_PEP_ID=MMETSP0087-20121206/22586_1 /TAXON_ID=136419 /ORGANISM="Unknown Unknown, Strain D1" /LENGTH=395 /DNA_ID=CAMNT_0016445815 /DNA_START=149 /DNA_END=1336 /DNA_ORIENTATION=-